MNEDRKVGERNMDIHSRKSQGVLNVKVLDILNSHEFTHQESVLNDILFMLDNSQEHEIHTAWEGLRLYLDHGELDEKGDSFCLMTKFFEILPSAEIELAQLTMAIELFLEKIYTNNTDIASGAKIIMKLVGPWEAFESEVLSYLRQEGLKRISKVIHSNRGEGSLGFGSFLGSKWTNYGSFGSIGGQGFLTIITKAPIPKQLANSLYIITHEFNVQYAHQSEGWFRQLNQDIKEYNNRSRMEYDQLDHDRFSTYFAKFKTEIASRKESSKTNNTIFDPTPLSVSVYKFSKMSTFPEPFLSSRLPFKIPIRDEETFLYKLGEQYKIGFNSVLSVSSGLPLKGLSELPRYIFYIPQYEKYNGLVFAFRLSEKIHGIVVIIFPVIERTKLPKKAIIEKKLAELVDSYSDIFLYVDEELDEDFISEVKLLLCQEKIPKDTYRVHLLPK